MVCGGNWDGIFWYIFIDNYGNDGYIKFKIYLCWVSDGFCLFFFFGVDFRIGIWCICKS